MTQQHVLPVGPDFGFGLYVHWPYCSRICPYCDFNVYTARGRDSGALVEAICRDIRRHRRDLPEHPALDSVFFGGGTPSLLQPSEIEQIITVAQQQFSLSQHCEVSIEANPNDVTGDRLANWNRAGINRVSLGVQSLDDAALAFLGRDHDAAGAQHAMDSVAALFPNHSVDLIYARPDQSLDDWSQELEAVLERKPPHLSLYELTIEPGTAFGRRARRGDLVAMDDDGQADLYDLTQELCSAAGLPAYEISNHAAAAEFQSVHNHIYWASGDWIGVGPGAHGRLTRDGVRSATVAPLRPADYIEATDTENEALDALGIARELIAMGLREAQGFELDRLDRLGLDVDRAALGMLIEAGIVELSARRLALTRRGRLLADRVTAELAP